jgi:hypothetical protein
MSIFPRSSTNLKCFLLFAVPLTFLGCSQLKCSPLTHQAQPLLHVTYLGGGPAPLVAELIVENGGLLRFTSFRNKEFCSADSVLADNVAQLLAFREITKALADVRRCPSKFSINDAEQVVFSFNGEDLALSMTRVPPELIPLLKQLDQGFSRRFGRRYNVPLVPEKRPASESTVANCPD